MKLKDRVAEEVLDIIQEDLSDYVAGLLRRRKHRPEAVKKALRFAFFTIGEEYSQYTDEIVKHLDEEE